MRKKTSETWSDSFLMEPLTMSDSIDTLRSKANRMIYLINNKMIQLFGNCQTNPIQVEKTERPESIPMFL